LIGRKKVGWEFLSELCHGGLGFGWELRAAQTGLYAGYGKPGDGLDHLLGQAGVGRIAAPGTAGQFRPHLVSLGFPLGRLHLVASRAGDLGEIVVVAG
jgi:hypothetical protein